jgi:hypothetical protein
MFWRDEDSKSIVLVTVPSGAPTQPSLTTGTGFVVGVEKEVSYVVTCSHVVEKCNEKRQLLVMEKRARVVSGLAAHKGIDLALLRVDGRLCDRYLIPAEWVGSQGIVPGWSALGTNDPEQVFRPLSVEIGRETRTLRLGLIESVGEILTPATWVIRVKGDASLNASEADHESARLHPGYSGAPVICPRSGRVVAVVRILDNDPSPQSQGGKSGLAISIKHLRDIWPADMPDPLPSSHPEPPVDDEECRWLAGLFGALPNGVSLWDLRELARREWPEVAATMPRDEDGECFLFWLLSIQIQANGHLPLYDALSLIVLKLAETQAGNDAIDLEVRHRRQRLDVICERLRTRHDLLQSFDHPQQARESQLTRDSVSACVDIELVRDGSASANRYDAHLVHHRGDGIPCEAEVRIPRLRIDPSAPHPGVDLIEAVTGFLNERRIPSDSARLTFRVQRELLCAIIHDWRPDHQGRGLPLGILYPVVVQSKERHDSTLLQTRWRESWQALNARDDRTLGSALHWWRAAPADANEASREAFWYLGAGACLALAYPPHPTREEDFLIHLLWQQGTPVLLWTTVGVDADGLIDAADQEIVRKTPWDRLPELLGERRKVAFRPGAAADPIAPLVLLWDPPTKDEPAGWFGASEIPTTSG